MGESGGVLCLAGVLVLNLLDLVATLVYVLLGFATEANPVMATVLALGPVVFGAAKLSLVSLGVALLWRLRRFSGARRAAVLCLVAYIGVAAVHVLGVAF